MEIDVFTLSYLKYIFSNFWTFLGFVIILLILTNYVRFVLFQIKSFLFKVVDRYKKLDKTDTLMENLSRLKPDFLDKVVKKD